MGLKNALTSLSFRARALRSSFNAAANSSSSSSSSTSRRPHQRTQLNHHLRGGGGASRNGEPSVALGGLLRSRSALDVRNAVGYGIGARTSDSVVSPVAEEPTTGAAMFSSRLAAFVQAQQQGVAASASAGVHGCARPAARRVEVGLQELADLVEVTRKGWKMGYEGRKPFLVDVREPHELELHPGIPGSINIPLSVLKASLTLSPEDFSDTFLIEKPDYKNADVVFYGRGPNNSMTALEIAHKNGYKVSRHFPDGISAWESYMNNFGVVDLL